MRRVVIETPLIGIVPHEEHQRYALWCAYDCYLRGEAPYLGSLFHALYLDASREEECVFALQAGYDWETQAEAHIFYLDLSWTVNMERARNRCNGKKVEHRHLPPELLTKFQAGQRPGPYLGRT